MLLLRWHWAYCEFCPTRAAQKEADANSYTFGVVASSCKSAGQLVAEGVINGVRVAHALVDTGSALSMLSPALYARLPDAPAIQPSCAPLLKSSALEAHAL